jgi:hypothetical protein
MHIKGNGNVQRLANISTVLYSISQHLHCAQHPNTLWTEASYRFVLDSMQKKNKGGQLLRPQHLLAPIYQPRIWNHSHNQKHTYKLNLPMSGNALSKGILVVDHVIFPHNKPPFLFTRKCQTKKLYFLTSWCWPGTKLAASETSTATAVDGSSK